MGDGGVGGRDCKWLDTTSEHMGRAWTLNNFTAFVLIQFQTENI